jgi:hypothetical protein
MRQGAVFVACLALMLAVAGTARAQATAVRVPVNEIVEACGEAVHVTGTMVLVGHLSFDDPGLFLLSRAATQSITGVGLTSGASYRGTTTTGTILTAGPGPAETSTHVSEIVLIGQGTVPDLVVHSTFHLTVTPTGNVAAFVDVLHAECR